MAKKKPTNPFYVLLVPVGIAFVITASAYAVTAMRAIRAGGVAAPAAAVPSSLVDFMSKNGERLLIGELLVLAITTVGAISTDGYWAKRAARTPPASPIDHEVNRE